MRFIGSKTTLINDIENVIKENTTGKEEIFCDLFSGTGSVGRYFKSKYKVYSNDLLHFSYVIQKATIENNSLPQFIKLKEMGIADPIAFLEESTIDYTEDYFISENYSPNTNCDRMYISTRNANRIDFIRHTIEKWKQADLLDDMEYFYLLAGLIEGVPYISNITGTYGAYLKTWDKRAHKEFEMMRLEVVDNQKNNRSFNIDSNKLIEEIEGDILYLDPPYNSRQYAPNYHLLETISKYDSPTIKGVTGMRDYSSQKSLYCVKSEVLSTFDDLISKAKFTHIVVSYSSDGLMTAEQIENVLKKYGQAATFKRYDVPYRKYKGKLSSQKDTLYEYIFYIRKDFERESKENSFPLAKQHSIQQTKKYIKSPLNYIGGKYKLLPQIIPLFPSKINTFVDLFSGGANVGININANQVICNDINSKIIEMFIKFQEIPEEEVLFQIERNIKSFKLSKENKDGFLKFRDYYNESHNPIDLYTLVCFSFNYQFRFNNDLKYNNPFGKDRSSFSESMKKNLLLFLNKLRNSNVLFSKLDFNLFDTSKLTSDDLVYCDPPYFITTGSYNDGNRGFKDWKEAEEKQLYLLLDSLNEKNVRFALSNVLTHKGKTNTILLNWSKKYNTHYLDYNYSNSSHNTIKGASEEVLITNY